MASNPYKINFKYPSFKPTLEQVYKHFAEVNNEYMDISAPLNDNFEIETPPY